MWKKKMLMFEREGYTEGCGEKKYREVFVCEGERQAEDMLKEHAACDTQAWQEGKKSTAAFTAKPVPTSPSSKGRAGEGV